ncbi:MAG: glutamate formimidoyltransferase [Actinomycetota bacterium]
MSLLSIPNISAGSDRDTVRRLSSAVASGGGRLLDSHTDPIHNRTVFTVHGHKENLVASMTALARAAKEAIDLRSHHGVHPRIGSLDVCPFVPLDDHDLPRAVEVAEEAGRAIAEETGIPVYLYGAAARRPDRVQLPDLRRAGAAGLLGGTMRPDFGPHEIDPRSGVICVGARLPLVAFNIWLDADVEVARAAAVAIRAASGSLPGVRALGLPLTEGKSQVSMNLIDPATTSVDDVFAAVARKVGIDVIERTEIVGLAPARYMPNPHAQAARLMVPPGRSLESVLH